MKPLSPDDDFPIRLICASLARLSMLFLAVLGVLFRTSVPATAPVQTGATFEQIPERFQQGIELRIKPGDSFTSLLVRHQLTSPSLEELIHKLRPVVNVRTLPAGQKVGLLIDTKDDSARGLEVDVRKQVIRADASANGWLVNQSTLPLTSRLKVFRGRVTDDFAHSLIQAGLTSKHITLLQKIFGSDIDLRRDTKSGDRFAIVATEQFYIDGQRSIGPITAASLEIAGESYRAFQHGKINGQPQYFNSQGIRLPHRFLAAPLKYDRISSIFGLARPDPMTGKVRPHQAIDYAAVEGTPVMAVGEGVVEFAGWHRGYGYLVEIDHGDGYMTSYGHLSAFGNNVREGKRVKTGDVIGHVGKTGYTTGPHLHFEFSRNQEKLDYLTARMYAGETLTGAEMYRFRIARDETRAAMEDERLQISQISNPAYD